MKNAFYYPSRAAAEVVVKEDLSYRVVHDSPQVQNFLKYLAFYEKNALTVGLNPAYSLGQAISRDFPIQFEPDIIIEVNDLVNETEVGDGDNT